MKELGVIGLGVMGRNLVLNLGDKGIRVSVYNKTKEKMYDFIKDEVKGQSVLGFDSLEEFVSSLERPRKILLMIKAGEAVDSMIGQLLPLLEKGDLILDGGNTHFKDTAGRVDFLKGKGIHYIGLGVSGGEEGARNGPSLMPGGSKEAYFLVEDILLSIAAKTDSGPCCTLVGERAAGHFVKMVHNGIEYAMMEGIAESYDIMRKILKLSPVEISEVFEKWNEGELNSYLIEITGKILKYKEKGTERFMVDLILDKAGQKGTGKWTAESAFDLGIPAPTLSTAVEARVLSFFKEERQFLSKRFNRNYPKLEYGKDEVIRNLRESLLFVFFNAFVQGLWVIQGASKEYGYQVQLSEVLRIWKGGCIIRAQLLDFLREILQELDGEKLILKSDKALKYLMDRIEAIKEVTRLAKDFYIPVFAHNTALDFFFSMMEENLPANLIQAQRDFFGAHTFQRVDREGTFHINWE